MPTILALLIVGAAAGFLATRLMRVQLDVVTTVALGVAGALVGWFVLRVLVAVTGWVAGFVGAVIGSLLIVWLWKKYRG
ncbi:MAG: hypothetical protein RIR62_3165 [Pseudomonadota bacterium]|jgi:uncharacterized membrane protein YeaQ/YmgE (transglycosylase-associated protein family)